MGRHHSRFWPDIIPGLGPRHHSRLGLGLGLGLEGFGRAVRRLAQGAQASKHFPLGALSCPQQREVWAEHTDAPICAQQAHNFYPTKHFLPYQTIFTLPKFLPYQTILTLPNNCDPKQFSPYQTFCTPPNNSSPSPPAAPCPTILSPCPTILQPAKLRLRSSSFGRGRPTRPILTVVRGKFWPTHVGVSRWWRRRSEATA